MLFSLETPREFTNVSKNTPEEIGPGKYEISPVMGNRKGMKAPFGSRISKREIILTETLDNPSPADYDPKKMGGSVSVNSVFVSGTRRDVFKAKKGPGPVDYGHVNDWTPRKKGRTQRARLRTESVTSGFVGQDISGYTLADGKWVPMKKGFNGPEHVGPGSYTPRLASRSPSVSMERSSNREIFNIRDNPGPAAYHPGSTRHKMAIAISNTGRGRGDDDTGTAWVPQHQWVKTSSEGSAAFRSRENRDCFGPREQTPAPCAYHRERSKRNAPGNAFGHKQNREFGKPLNDNPGPAEYSPAQQRWLKGSNSQLGRSVQVDKRPVTPGPGAYGKEKKWADDGRPTSAFSSRTKRAQTSKFVTPAPDQYTPGKVSGAIHPQIRETRTEKGDWIERSKTDNPSPDSYQEVRIEPGRGRTISRITREQIDKDKFPGPGTYNVIHGSLKKKCLNARAPIARDDA